MPVEIGAEPGDVPGRDRYGGRKARSGRGGRIVCIRANSCAEPRRDRRQMRLQRRVCRDLPSLRGAGDPPHDEKRPADHLGIGAGPERLRHRDAGGEGRLLHREFLDPAEARRDAGRRVGAQHQRCRPAQAPADKFGLEAPILLDRAARQQFRLAYPDMARAARPARKRARRSGSNRGNAVAAIDRDDRAGDIGAGRRGQEQQRAVEIAAPDRSASSGCGRSAPCRHRSGKRRG